MRPANEDMVFLQVPLIPLRIRQPRSRAARSDATAWVAPIPPLGRLVEPPSHSHPFGCVTISRYFQGRAGSCKLAAGVLV
jgi:hypothetical protein